MINNYIGITGNDRMRVARVMERLINDTNAKIDQENIQMNIIINNDDVLKNCRELEKLGSKEILVLQDTDIKKIQGNIKSNILSQSDIEYIIEKYRNDKNE